MSLLVAVTACELDYPNPNAAGPGELDTSNGLLGLAIGIEREYAVLALDFAVFVPAMTTREVSLILTNVANQDVEKGGDALLSTNLRMINLFSSLTKVKGMAETLISRVPETTFPEAGTRSGLLAWGKFFRALCLGALAQSWEQVPLVNSINNDSKFVPRKEALEEAVKILNEALQAITQTKPSEEFTSVLEQKISLQNCINAYLSRYYLMLGENQNTLTTAGRVDLKSTSTFTYDSQNQNPMFVGMIKPGELLFYAPRVNFGLPVGLVPEAGDKRVSFYLTDSVSTSLTGNPVRIGTNAPFFTSASADIPVYLPGEIILNQAEAYARLNQTANAATQINILRKQTPATAPFGLGADLGDYNGGQTEAELLNEIYKNRRIELFLTGLSLEDSRRFNRPATERSRNFYPYPSTERANNPNTPENPDL